MITGFLQFVKIRIKIREELLYRIMIGIYLSLTLNLIRKIVSIVYSFILSKKMVRKWNALHGRGSRSRGKKMLIFRSRTLPETFTGRLYHVASSRSNIQRAACFFTGRGEGAVGRLQIRGGGLTSKENGPRYGGRHWKRQHRAKEIRFQCVRWIESKSRRDDFKDN